MASLWQPGQLLFAGFEGTTVPGELMAWVGQGRVGGIILFSRNIESPTQLRTLVEGIHEAAPAGAPVMVAIDQEGGRVQRLREPWTGWPPMRQLGDRDDPKTTRAVGLALGRELANLGILMDFAPVVDVDTNPNNPVIGDRSFGRDAARVARHAVPLVEGLAAAGVAACAKHFPGHGDTDLDSHLQLPRLAHDLARLREVELPPFAAVIEADVASIMTAHVVFEAIDAKRPATLSPEVMALLRDELGYDGVVFSDDLEMKAVADHYGPASLVEGALRAGVDSLLVCRSLDLCREVLQRLERAPDGWVEHGVRRMVALKQRYAVATPAPEPESPAAAAVLSFEQAVAQEIAAAAEPVLPREPPYPEHQQLAQRIVDEG